MLQKRTTEKIIFYCFSRIFLICSLTLLSFKSLAQLTNNNSLDALKKLSLEELMNIEVTSVSKRPEKLTEVASAIQVITQKDIRRSGATTLPEVLKLSPNLQVKQLKSSAWIISARGFNAAFANKLLVMIDGRTVYSPLFAGVFWDAQAISLESIERIEIISGPGGTLWGANAVNGVINIITKNAKDTKGLYASIATGTFLQRNASIRYGGNINSHVSYRLNLQNILYSNTFRRTTGAKNTDTSNISQAGLRVDWDMNSKNKLMLLGNFHIGEEKTVPAKSTFDGQNIQGRWTHSFSDNSELIAQVYFDRIWRHDIPSTINDQSYTYDFDLQHRFPVRTNNSILWGIGYRYMKDQTQHSTPYVGFVPLNRDMNLFSGFVQDEITLIPEKLKLTVGTKILHNTFSGWEIQPSGRFAWTPTNQHTIWTAISRAVRTPSRIDVDYHLPTYPVPPTSPSVAGGPNFTSEKVIAYELGYRIAPKSNITVSLAGFYNQYDDLYSVEALPGTQTYQIQNGGKGHSSGAELSFTYQVCKTWELRGGYTYFDKKIKNKPGHNGDYRDLGLDAKHQVIFQSILDLPENFQLDIAGRFVDSLPVTVFTPHIPSYFTFDMRIGWEFKGVELSLVGRGLSRKRQPEIGTMDIPRNFYARITCQL